MKELKTKQKTAERERRRNKNWNTSNRNEITGRKQKVNEKFKEK